MYFCKNLKMWIFWDELFGVSSDFGGWIWSKMKSLSVLDDFAPNFNSIWLLDHILSTSEKSIIFDFWFVGFPNIVGRISYFRSLIGQMILFSDRIHTYLFQTHLVLLNSKNLWIFVDFCILVQNHENYALSLAVRSSSGWVLITLKVLPSKSSWSQDYFTHI